MIFVFGSNKSGIHGAGAARTAYEKYGAQRGLGEGRSGNSYALPTKGYQIEFIPLQEVKEAVDRFIAYAKAHPEDTYQVTRVGCGLGGFRDSDIAPLFTLAPNNCQFDLMWRQYLPNGFDYWGTF